MTEPTSVDWANMPPENWEPRIDMADYPIPPAPPLVDIHRIAYAVRNAPNKSPITYERPGPGPDVGGDGTDVPWFFFGVTVGLLAAVVVGTIAAAT